MKEVSLHVLDVAENSINAGASLIEIYIKEDYSNNLLEIVIRDNGEGIKPDLVEKASDPFFTTKETRKVGLGLSMFKEACKRCDGEFYINSISGRGTSIKAIFKLNHIDLPPLGDMAGTISTLILSNPEMDIVYLHRVDNDCFELDTRRIKEELKGISINNVEIIKYIKESIKDKLNIIGAGKYTKMWGTKYAKTYNT